MNTGDKYLLGFVGAVIAGLYLYQARQQRSIDSGNTFLTDLIGSFKTMAGNVDSTSQAGLNAIKAREGVRYAVYADAIGLLTGGIGHLLQPSDGSWSNGDAIDPAQVDAWFASDISRAENIVKRYVSVPLTQNQFDALVSVVFNTGSHFFRNRDGTQTHVSKFIDAGDFASAAAQFDRWVFGANGVRLAGLVTRRAGERAQFEGVA